MLKGVKEDVPDILRSDSDGETDDDDDVDSDEVQEAKGREKGVGSVSSSALPYRRVQFSPKNRSRIFRAVLFLKEHLRDRAQPDNGDFKFTMARDGTDFRALASDLARAEPSLQGITCSALHSLYNRIDTERRELDKFLSWATGDPWTHTNLSNLTLNLVDVDDEIKQRQQRKATRKEEQIAEVEAIDAAVIARATGVRDSKKGKQVARIQTLDSGSSPVRTSLSAAASPAIAVAVSDSAAPAA
ncbi:hypothetical protein BGZ65_003961 [Modicella reniformis]|uniref:Uncharacterized protein n=1 Tax=Modicella reniformis TaxID=1440133 RepID=A0A9P6MHG4_9FUNG|nr:hypothetical protein BGZ65_003961 [Modicella reniformis]